MPGVVRVVTGSEMAEHCEPWVGVLTHFKGLKSAPQHAIAVNQVAWQGEAVAAVVANSRAEAEDAAAMIEVEYDVLPAVTDAETAGDPGHPCDPSRNWATMSRSRMASMRVTWMRPLPRPIWSSRKPITSTGIPA